jgi:4-hydroxymandelate synthase
MIVNSQDGSIAYVELYVNDGASALDYLTRAFAFTAVAHAEHPDRHSVLLDTGSARLIVTEPRGGGAVAEWLAEHGDGVRDIALYRSDLDRVTERAGQARLPVLPPSLDIATGTFHARVGGFGAVWHTLLLRIKPDTDLPPGFNWQPLDTTAQPTPSELKLIDHIAICLPAGALEPTAATYQSIFDMQIIRSERTEVGDTATNSHVLRDATGLTLVMLEPDPAKAPGQIDQFLAMNREAGVQHLAFLTDDIVAAVREYGARGVGFAPAPPGAYYQGLAERVADAPELGRNLADLRETGVLLDRDEDGSLYQIFTTSPHERDTLFYELVERRGNKGFGTNNIVALFKAREADLLARSTPSGSGR